MRSYSIFAFLVFCSVITGPSFSQNEDEKVKTPSALDGRIQSKTFEFVAITVFPSGQPPKDISGSNYSISFSPEAIASHLPFYGTGYSGVALTRDKGMRFKGSPQDFIVEDSERGYVVSAKVAAENDVYSISINISDSGTATLNISSNNRSSISYFGEVK